MPPEMRSNCEKCKGSLTVDGEAYICTYECTFCPSCAGQIKYVCPNCGGELVRRPRRKQDG